MKRQAGFSLLEIVVVAAVLGIMVVLISIIYTGQLINYSRTETLTILQSNTKQAVETMAKDIRAARTVETNNTWPDANSPGAPGNLFSWTSSSGSPSTLVLAVPAQDSSGNLLYVDPATHNTLHTNDVIYYVSQPGTPLATLYRRVLANPVPGNTAITTCPPPGVPGCPADGKVIEDVANLQVEYYDTANAITASPTTSYSLNVVLTEYRSKFGRTYTSTLNTHVTLRNKP